MSFIFHFYIIFGTNLLIGGPAQICCFFAYFSVSKKRNIKRSRNGTKSTGEVIFGRKATRKAWSARQESNEGGTRQGARPPPSWAPRGSPDVLLPSIYTHVPPSDQIRSQKPNSTTATFCTHEIPSWGLFRSSAGRGPSSRRASTSS